MAKNLLKSEKTYNLNSKNIGKIFAISFSTLAMFTGILFGFTSGNTFAVLFAILILLATRK